MLDLFARLATERTRRILIIAGIGLPARRRDRRSDRVDPEERILGLPGPARAEPAGPARGRTRHRAGRLLRRGGAGAEHDRHSQPIPPPQAQATHVVALLAQAARLSARARLSGDAPARARLAQRALRRSCSRRSPTANARRKPSNTSVPQLAGSGVRLGGNDVAFQEINERTSSDLRARRDVRVPAPAAALLLGLPRPDRRRAAAARGRVSRS